MIGWYASLRKGMTSVMALPFHLLPTDWLQQLMARVAKKRAARLPAQEALRFLFGLDQRLYAEQGKHAVRYGGGVHTKHRHMNYHRFFSDRISETDHVLDIGCGIGAVAHHVATVTGARVVGVDYNERNLEQARRQFSHPRIEYRCGDALKTLPDETFDVVVLSNVLEHLPERPAFLRRVVDATGARRLLIRVPLFERDWRVPLKRELGLDWRLDDDHETEYTLESFQEEMREAELEIRHLEVRWGEIWAEVGR